MALWTEGLTAYLLTYLLTYFAYCGWSTLSEEPLLQLMVEGPYFGLWSEALLMKAATWLACYVCWLLGGPATSLYGVLIL